MELVTSLSPPPADAPPAPVLIQALDGFIDAGGAARLARQHLLGGGHSEVVATFDVDELLDYRARRPLMLFAQDHWESYDGPALELRRLHDDTGTPFLLLVGPEPDVQWERFVAAVEELCVRFGVVTTVGLNAIPMAVPHTRPLGVIAHGSRKELVAGFDTWVSTVRVPASAGHLLEFRRGQSGRDAMGFAVHVPHYLAQVDYPAASAVLLDVVSRATGLVLPTASLLQAADAVREGVDAQVASSTEIAEVVAALEAQYDAFVRGRGSGLLAGDGLPTADELGAELERFLAQQHKGDGQDG
ncbi:MAG: PAC2 family protein [Actinomycetota bacterium]|nr:PAC2 family protein [Actinomycetota bacterium]